MIFVFILLLISTIVSCRPSVQSSEIKQIKNTKVEFDEEGLDKRYKPCLFDEDLNELCERCMRIAAHPDDDIFAMCCVDEDDAQSFCRNYVFYGIT